MQDDLVERAASDPGAPFETRILAQTTGPSGIINSGHNWAQAHVVRAAGETFEPKQFATWAPKANVTDSGAWKAAENSECHGVMDSPAEPGWEARL